MSQLVAGNCRERGKSQPGSDHDITKMKTATGKKAGKRFGSLRVSGVSTVDIKVFAVALGDDALAGGRKIWGRRAFSLFGLSRLWRLRLSQ